MKPTRRGFLLGLVSAPFVARVGVLMPVRGLAMGFLPGDLVQGSLFRGAQIVHRVEGATAYLWNNAFGPARAVEPVPVATLNLCEGLPGNRVDNPSMRHRLVRAPGGLGLRYLGE